MTKTNDIRLKIILGSTRQGRFSDKPGAWIAAEAKKIAGVDAEILDLRDYPMPFYDETVSPSMKTGDYANEAVVRWSSKIGEADAFIIITPEYNHAPPAVLKNALDYVSKEWNKKPVAFISYGSVGGARAVEQLREIAVEFQMAPIRDAVLIPAHWGMMDATGALKPGALDGFVQAGQSMLAQLLWWANALKTARVTA